MFALSSIALVLRRTGLVLAACCWAAAQAQTSPDPSLEPALNESLLLVPSGPTLQPSLEATVFMPDGPGPFPLAVLNHGTLGGASRQQPRWRPVHLVLGWLQRGYAVLLPNRAGYANSGGGEGNPPCPRLDERALDGGAQVRRSIDALLAQRGAHIDASRIVVLGHSDGVFSTVGYATQPHPGVRAAFNLAGGLRSSLAWCPWEDMVEQGLASVAPAAAQVPMMWLYAENDALFGPALAQRWFKRWQAAGGQAVLRLLPPLGRDGHQAVIEPAGLPVVWNKLDALLAAAKLPTEVVQTRFTAAQEAQPAASGFASIDAVDQVPHLGERQRQIYRDFLRQPLPRAFALSPDGAVGWASDNHLTQAAALRWCNRSAAPGRPCRLYAVDQRVVWQPETTTSTHPAPAATMPSQEAR